MEEILKKKSKIIAAILSFIWPGFGHIYIGQGLVGLTLIFLVLVFRLLNSYGLLELNPYLFLSAVFFVVIMYFVILLHSVLTIQKIKVFPIKFYNRWYYYLLLILFVLVANEILPVRFKTFHATSISMAPTILAGDYVYTSYDDKEFKRGDVVAFTSPKDKQTYINRIVAIVGDEIEMINKIVYVNGISSAQYEVQGVDVKNMLSEILQKLNPKVLRTKTGDIEHNILIIPSMAFNSNFDKKKIPAGNVFILGDNRDLFADSRMWGFLPVENIISKAKFVYFARTKTFWKRMALKI